MDANGRERESMLRGVNCVRMFLSYGSFLMEPDRLMEDGLRKFDEIEQARWCRAVVERAEGWATGWLNWGFYDQPEATDVSQSTGLLTAEGRLKAWGREFSRLSKRLSQGPFKSAPPSLAPALDLNLCTTSPAAGNRFREENVKRFRTSR
jgi:hypothetical protein